MMKTIAVLGGSYGGARAAAMLAAGVPENYRVVLVDRNTHFNHVYVFPRMGVITGHEHKAFIPLYSQIFSPPKSPSTPPATDMNRHVYLNTHIESFSPTSVQFSNSFPEHNVHNGTLKFDYAIYALGSKPPAPLNLWASGGDDESVMVAPYGGTKAEGIEWMKRNQERIKKAGSVLVVGGGALGIQFATDIAAIYPSSKSVTLLHSRRQLLPKFNENIHSEVLKSLQLSEVDVILGERLDLNSVTEQPPKRNKNGQRIVRTLSGREVAADLLLLCTGQQPNTDFLRSMDATTVDPETSLAHVLRSMQLSTSKPEEPLEEITEEHEIGSTPYPHLFAIGDAADAFGAIAAGHTAHWQAEVAARNVLRLIKGESPLEKYKPGPPAIKVSLGLKHSVYEVQGEVGTKDDVVEDLGAPSMWTYYGVSTDDMYV